MYINDDAHMYINCILRCLKFHQRFRENSETRDNNRDLESGISKTKI